ncbi:MULTISPECIES: hypothetical protein [Ureibacillus]|uniref:hypothetical protein n=1 Tax=Ureibacillus TaxID=160795 RepID=UPI001559D9F5|nr:hypothetical protein [Ureibacillus thermosphaericus]
MMNTENVVPHLRKEAVNPVLFSKFTIKPIILNPTLMRGLYKVMNKKEEIAFFILQCL